MGDVSAGGADVLRAWSNPSFLVDQGTKGEIALNGGSKFAGENTTGGLGAGWRLGGGWVAGLLGSYYSAGLDAVDENGDPTGRTLGHQGVSVGVAAGRQWRSVRAGLTAKVVSESLRGQAATTGALDAGVSVPWHDVWFAASIRNLGPEIRPKTAQRAFGEALPTELRAGLAYGYEPWDLKAGVEFSDVFKVQSKAGAGVEWWPHPVFGVRAGATGLGVEDGVQVTAGITGLIGKLAVDY
jgi:hypothetical protein